MDTNVRLITFVQRGIRDSRIVAFTLATVIVTAIIMGFAIGAVWGAVVTAASSSVLTCIALFQSWKDREDLYRPRVIFYVHREGDDILFYVSNVGLRSAFDVQVTLSRPVMYRVGDKDWNDKGYHDLREFIGFLHDPIAMLAPSQTLTSLNRLQAGEGTKLSEVTLDRFLDSDNENISGVIHYIDQGGNKYSDVTTIGFKAFKNMKLIATANRSS